MASSYSKNSLAIFTYISKQVCAQLTTRLVVFKTSLSYDFSCLYFDVIFSVLFWCNLRKSLCKKVILKLKLKKSRFNDKTRELIQQRENVGWLFCQDRVKVGCTTIWTTVAGKMCSKKCTCPKCSTRVCGMVYLIGSLLASSE